MLVVPGTTPHSYFVVVHVFDFYVVLGCLVFLDIRIHVFSCFQAFPNFLIFPWRRVRVRPFTFILQHILSQACIDTFEYQRKKSILKENLD